MPLYNQTIKCPILVADHVEVYPLYNTPSQYLIAHPDGTYERVDARECIVSGKWEQKKKK